MTVILPTYNRPWGLRRAIGSVLAQTYPHFELLVMDDCSGPETEAVARSFADPRIRYVRQPENVGVGSNWGDGVRRADAPYVCFLMDDDYYDPSFLENRVALLQRQPKALLVFSGYRRVSLDGKALGETRPACRDGEPYDSLSLLHIFLVQGGVFIGGFLFHREPVLRAWADVERYDLVVDYALAIRLTVGAHGSGVYCGALDFNMCSHEGQMFHARSQRVYAATEQVLRDQLPASEGRYRAVLRRAYVRLLASWARETARRRERGPALQRLVRSVVRAPYSPDLYRTWAYTLCLILGLKP